jgi:hypothetical protein
MSKLIICGCRCHKGNMYIVDDNDIVSKIIHEQHISMIIGSTISIGAGFRCKEVTNIQTIINTIISDLT